MKYRRVSAIIRLIFQSQGHADDIHESFPKINYFTSLYTVYGFVLAVVYDHAMLHMARLKFNNKYHDYQKKVACKAHLMCNDQSQTWSHSAFIKWVHPAVTCITWQVKPVHGSQFLYNHVILFIEANQMSSAYKQNNLVMVDMKSSSGLDNLLKPAFGQNSFQLFL